MTDGAVCDKQTADHQDKEASYEVIINTIISCVSRCDSLSCSFIHNKLKTLMERVIN